ncbi:MAG: hypothetical protein ACI870_000249 [Crocinitomicaceae bacterium]|jgi:hypothetical protein
MKKRNEKYILIFFLLVWIGFVGWIYVYELGNKTETTNNTDSKDRSKIQDYYDNEPKGLARKNENNQIDNKNIDFLNEELFLFADSEISTGKQADPETSFETKENRNKPVLDKRYFRDTDNSEIIKNQYNGFVIQPQLEESLALENIIVLEPLCGEFTCYSSNEFLNIYNNFEINQNLSFLNKYIYQIDDVDDYIRKKAEQRGYRERGFADELEIIQFENIRTRPEVKSAYISLRNEMLNDNIRLHFVSGYRSSTSQRAIFKKKMESINPIDISSGIHDVLIDDVLSRSAIPAYSKHHSGYAVDFGCGNNYLVYSFAETECYDWMSDNNFENIKKHGFIPSYPEGVASQGPNPEPWEYVWVGKENI